LYEIVCTFLAPLASTVNTTTSTHEYICTGIEVDDRVRTRASFVSAKPAGRRKAVPTTVSPALRGATAHLDPPQCRITHVVNGRKTRQTEYIPFLSSSLSVSVSISGLKTKKVNEGSGRAEGEEGRKGCWLPEKVFRVSRCADHVKHWFDSRSAKVTANDPTFFSSFFLPPFSPCHG
jgi:hypothetical protein